MTWVRVAGKNINLDLASRYEVQDKAGGKSITLHFGKGDIESFKGVYAEALIEFLEKAKTEIGPQESPTPESPTPTPKKKPTSFAEQQQKAKRQGC
jgi:hypothetical protein